MRLVIQRSTQDADTGTLYVLACGLEVSTEERSLLSAVPGVRWHRPLIECGIDSGKLLEQNYRVAFKDALDAAAHEQCLRDVFAGLRDYLKAAQAHTGEVVDEIHPDDLTGSLVY